MYTGSNHVIHSVCVLPRGDNNTTQVICTSYTDWISCCYHIITPQLKSITFRNLKSSSRVCPRRKKIYGDTILRTTVPLVLEVHQHGTIGSTEVVWQLILLQHLSYFLGAVVLRDGLNDATQTLDVVVKSMITTNCLNCNVL